MPLAEGLTPSRRHTKNYNGFFFALLAPLREILNSLTPRSERPHLPSHPTRNDTSNGTTITNRLIAIQTSV